MALIFIPFEKTLSRKQTGDNLETYREQIAKSQILLLQQNRPQALHHLLEAFNKEVKKSNAAFEIEKSIHRIATYFLSEKSQQLYQLGVAHYGKDKKLALSYFQQARQMDSTNTLIIKAEIFTDLGLNDCRSSKKNFDVLIDLNPLDKEIALLETLDTVCKKEKDSILRAKIVTLTHGEWKLMALINLLRLEPQESIFQELEKASIAKNSDPEALYWLWQYNKDVEKRKKLGDEYRNLCHSAIPFDKAYGWFDPWACGHLDEMAAERD